MDSNSPSQCHALNVSDEKRCLEKATSINGLFCSFHSRQCQGLYRGYKLRTAKLERLDENIPSYLAHTKVPLVNQTFEGVTTEEECKELHDWLWTKYQLLERVIRARRLHHSRFFSLQMDYGHEKFLDQLVNQKGFVTKALERLERRSAEVLYKNKQWFKWVRECQDDEELHREKEQKKIKQEAQLWQRNWKQAKQRAEEYRKKEEKKKQDAFLEKVYKEKMKEREIEDADDEMDWDPIEDILEDGRGNFVDLIRHFLWMVSPEDQVMVEPKADEQSKATPQETDSAADINNNTATQPESSASSKKAKKKKKKSAAVANTSGAIPTSKPQELPDKSLIESREAMHDRLAYGTEINRGRGGMMIVGSVENPVMETKTRSFPEDDIQRFLGEISEIKHLLFCRLLLGHVALLPAALRAESIDSFLADEEVTGIALRDICLKMEKPGLQEIRDACADFFRSEHEEEEDVDEEIEPKDEDDKEKDEPKDPYDIKFEGLRQKPGVLPEKWLSKRERAREAAKKNFGDMVPSWEDILGGSEGTAVNFGERKDQKNGRRKIRVQICGRTIWNYPSDKAMSRGGWLHFCLIAKDSSLHAAVSLCRNWEEFFELNILACWNYFPGANWATWVGNRYKQQALQLGFIMYFDSSSPDARDLSVNHTQGRRGKFRRAHAVFEARNIVCAHIKRDDQASRRFIQYLSMQTHSVIVLVRDAESGRLLIKPPEEELWLWREKSGLGRASKNEWNILKKVGPEFFEEVERYRQWSFSFKEYYDIYVWDYEAGRSFAGLFNLVQEMLMKALRCRSGADLYNLAAPILKTIYRDDNDNLCDIKPGDTAVCSVWDSITDSRSKFYFGPMEAINPDIESNTFPRNLLYNDADVLEDEILFPEERSTEKPNPLSLGTGEPLSTWEEEGFSLKKFIDASWEWEDSDYESDEMSVTDSDNSDQDESIEDEDEDEDYSENGDDFDEFLPSPRDAGVVKDTRLLELFPEELRDVMRRLSLKDRSMPAKDDPQAMHDEFFSFLDREKARVFKKVWHMADLTPNSQEQYSEMISMTKQSRKFNQESLKTSSTLLSFELLDWLDVMPPDCKDLHKALGKIYPFFNPEFLESEKGNEFKNSLMFNQEERAKTFPDIRTHTSPAYRPDEFYDDFDKVCKRMKHQDDLDEMPFEWDLAIRPIIAHLYKSGVIRSHASTLFEGQAFSATEPARPGKPDLFIDWRPSISSIIAPPGGLNTPMTVTPLLHTARAFLKSQPKAKFAVLNLWTGAHFYPLMVGYDKRHGVSFRDLVGRRYAWLFVPKDLPYSEYSIHVQGTTRIAPFQRQFGKKVVVKRDKFLVMGEDEQDLLKMVAGVTYAIQMRPWRLEVDLWKSFMNVDLEFLERLDKRWWD